MNSYELSRAFIDWAFENPDKIKPIHYGIYYFAIEHCNRLGWKDKFGLPSQMVMEAIGVKNWRTYSAGLNDLVEFGFIKMIEISKNQYSSNIIAIVKNTKAPTKATTKALDKALSTHSTKHSQSTVSIDKQSNNITIIQSNKDELEDLDFSLFDNLSIIEYWRDWLVYKKEQFKDEYKSSKSNQIAINKLAKLCNGNSNKAKLIIEESISNLYKGLFELKTNNNANTKQPISVEQRNAEYLAETIRSYREQTDGVGPCEDSQNRTDDFTTFEIMQE